MPVRLPNIFAAVRRNWKVSAAGLIVAAMWGFHAAANSLPGRAYLRISGLNDSARPVGLNIVLLPAFLIAIAGLMLPRVPKARSSSRCGIAIGGCCWLLGATLSAVINMRVDQVALTYCVVFLAAMAVYAVFSRVRLTPRDLEIAIAGLVIGSLFPLFDGIQAFRSEWGSIDAETTLSAYRDLFRMQLYETATFGNRGNTAAFVVLVAPVMLWIALDETRSKALRLLCAAALVPVVMNTMILQVRAAFIALMFALALIWGFKLGLKRYPLFAAGLTVAILLLSSYSPDVMATLTDRLRPVVMADTAEDVSVMERADSIKEGLTIAEGNWQLGTGPGSALTRHSHSSAHQFQVQQFMENGILGLLGSALVSFGVLFMMVRTLLRGRDGGTNNMRFALLVGPAAFVIYGVMANATFNIGYVNTWTVIMVSMIALTPPIESTGFRRSLIGR
jgi:O-antigen ligase/polysaccharide polymerase Wzy-like membrane protein